MVYLLYELAKIPEFQARLYEELSMAVMTRYEVPEQKDLQNLPLLQALINETLRLHPAIVGILPRETMVDMVVEGIAVPREVSVENVEIK